ncbi:flavodoxin [Bacillus pumilus]|uniref:flavodoxin n=1 Tax=Bacillus safensis TaxID=561879 RepID=UPI0006401994|nr:flavodoxin [Bacillus safensis]KLK98543.1 flavodoxin [Bacillus pumilus]
MKALIAFASMSGNTEDMAAILKQTLEGKGIDTEMMEFDDTNAEDLSSYDYVFIGSYTWGDGDLPYEAEDFYEEVSSLELSHIKAAVFGSGDYSYPKFCEAVHTFHDMLKSTGASVFPETLKMELAPDTDEDVACCQEFAVSFLTWAALSEKRVENHVS